MRRVTNAETIVRKRAVFMLVGRDVDIAVVEVVVRAVPVAVLQVSLPSL